MERTTLLKELKRIVSGEELRRAALEKAAALIKESGNHRWVGLYAVDHAAGLVSNLVWSGPGAPEFPTFPITKDLTNSAISAERPSTLETLQATRGTSPSERQNRKSSSRSSTQPEKT